MGLLHAGRLSFAPALGLIALAFGASGAPVVFEGKTLYELHSRLGKVRPEERAQFNQQRLYRFAKDSNIPISAVHTEDEGEATEILAGDSLLTTITDDEAKATGRPREAMAEDYANRIRDAVSEYRRVWAFKRVALRALYASLVTVLLVALLIGIWKLHAQFRALVAQWSGSGIRVRRFQTPVSLFERQILALLPIAEALVRWAAVLFLFSLYLPLALSFFPGTAGAADKVFAWTIAPFRIIWNGFVRYLPNLFFLAVIILVTYAAIRLNRIFFHAIGDGTIGFERFRQDWAAPTEKLVRGLLILLALIVAYPHVPGSDSPAFKGLSVFVGVLFSLGSGSVVSNALAGTVLVYTGAFRDGDRIRLGEHLGDIVERSLFVTRIRTTKNEIVSIPNSSMMAGSIVNYSADARTRGLILYTSVTIGYDAPWRTVHKLLIDAARKTDGIIPEPSPYVLEKDLGDFYVTYEINAYTNRPNEMAAIYSALRENIQDEFNDAGVEIMSAHYFSLRDGNKTTIPPEHLPSDYEAPAFRQRVRNEDGA